MCDNCTDQESKPSKKKSTECPICHNMVDNANIVRHIESHKKKLIQFGEKCLKDLLGKFDHYCRYGCGNEGIYADHSGYRCSKKKEDCPAIEKKSLPELIKIIRDHKCDCGELAHFWNTEGEKFLCKVDCSFEKLQENKIIWSTPTTELHEDTELLCIHGCGRAAKFIGQYGPRCRNRDDRCPNLAKKHFVLELLNNEVHLCEYGCGKLAKFYSTNSKNFRCSESPNGCSAVQTRKQENTEIPIRIEDTGESCCYGCGEPGHYWTEKQNGYRCKEMIMQCQAILDSADRTGPREGEYFEISDHICDYGCGEIGHYKLHCRGNEIKWCCGQYYQACPAYKKDHSDQMTEKYKDPEVKKTFLAKMNETNLETHGVPWAAQIEDHIEKREQTCNSRYGVSNYSKTEYFKSTFVEPLVRNTAQLYKGKDYQLPSGRVIKVQGYSPWALDDLLKFIDENDLLFEDECPRIKYWDNRTYYPDIYRKSTNHILEVKGIYTYFKDYDKNKAKEAASIAQGYEFSFLIYEKGILLDEKELEADKEFYLQKFKLT